MPSAFNGPVRDASLLTFSFLAYHFGALPADANPTGQRVTQGNASFNSAGSQFTVTAANDTVINWSSFNIAPGETTTFVQPSSTSVVWNQINDPNPSQILGTLNANGYVVLQNQNGFVVGGAASITTHGLLMTTSPTPPPTLSSGGAWEFDALPPTASIVNYGQITSVGGPAFLIANNILNANDPVKGTGVISAEQNTVGLYAGQEVLVSTSPDGRGISARVTLPAGSVDNEGRLIADGGSIMARAATVNQNGLAQANTVVNDNGVIELVASGDLTVGAKSDIEANGDAGSGNPSNGGFVVLQAGGNYSDTPGSVINVGNQNGGQDGVIQVFGSNLSDASSLQSQIGNNFALFVNPYDLFISGNNTDPSSANFSASDLGTYTHVDLHALNNIEFTSPLTLVDPGTTASLSLEAGNSIVVDSGMSIRAGKDWSLNLTAGTAFVSTAGQPAPAPGGGDGELIDGTIDSPLYSYGVYLDDGASITAQDQDINIWAANEVIIHDIDLSTGARGGAIRTLAGGNINVTAEYGDVNTGNDVYGYTFGLAASPYYKVNTSKLGGISTAAGGNVTINAGGDVISYLPTQSDLNNYGYAFDGGTGAFSTTQPGNVTINAGGSVYGNYVVGDGTGVINAGANAGSAYSLNSPVADFALSLVNGAWTVNAQNIYLDDVLNPNGVFNDSQNNPAGAHVFDYSPTASLTLNAVNGAEITGAEVPLLPASDPTVYPIPVLLPPSLSVTTGAGGFRLDSDVILFPSSTGNANLSITTQDGGSFTSLENLNSSTLNVYTLEMSDSGQNQWLNPGGLGTETFGYADLGAAPTEINNPNPVTIKVAGNITDVVLRTDKHTDVTVSGNMFNCSLITENLNPNDVSSVNVAGSISYSPVYAFTPVSGSITPGTDWESVFSLAVNDLPGSQPQGLPNSVANPIPTYDLGNPVALRALAGGSQWFQGNPGFVYVPKNGSTPAQLGFAFQMLSLYAQVLEGKEGALVGIKTDALGNPEVALGQASLGQDPTQYYFVTTPLTLPHFLTASAVQTLYQESLSSVANSQSLPYGFQIGGPGELSVQAGSVDLGASGGIISWGSADGSNMPGGINYGYLGSLTDNAGASIDLTATTGDISMLTSTIATINGGGITVDNQAGSVNLGLSGLALTPVSSGNLAYGIYTAGAGDVSVTANESVNIDTARIATFNGGNVNVESLNGDVNAGSGANLDLQIPFYLYNPKTGLGDNLVIEGPRPYGSGILALAPSAPYQVNPGTGKVASELPGNITVETPNGNIESTLGGIAQFALDNNVGPGPFVTLTAGTVGVKASKTQGNINLGQGGVIGGTVNLNAQGNITGLIVSRQDTTVKAVENVDVTVLSVGTANVSAGGSLSGVLIGMSGITASGGAGITASMLSSSVSANGAAAGSTLGAATASASATSAAATSSTDTKQELAATDTTDDDKKKKKPLTLMQRIKRVTVILPRT